MSATTIVVNDVEPRRQYTATAAQTLFDFPIPFFETDDLTVWLTPVGQTADDAADLLTITTDYTVSGENTQDGGLVTLVVAATAGDIITIERIVDIERLADYQNSGDLLAETLNKEQDTEIFISQQLRQDINRGVKLSKTSTSQIITLEDPEPGKYLKVSSSGESLEMVNLLDIGVVDKTSIIYKFDTVALMVADTTLSVGDTVETLGYLSKGDGGGNQYEIVAAGTGTDDGGSYIDLSGSVGQAKALFPGGVVNDKQFGTVADGVAEDSSKLQAASDYGEPVFVTGTAYSVSVAVTGSFYSLGDTVISGAGTIAITNLLLSVVTISPNSPRDIIQYKSATSINIRANQYAMGGFRFHGQYSKTNVPVFPAASKTTVVSTATDLAFGMSSVVLENWYGVFACANDGDAAVTMRVVPFLRIKEDLTGGVFRLGVAGEGITAAEVATPSTLSTQTYPWAVDALASAELLVITETVDGRGVAFSGRETTIIANTTTSITIADSGAIAGLDWVIPAPNVEFDHYRYCGAFYVDTAEVRNIADSGSAVTSRGTSDQSGTNTGTVSPAEKREPSGNISPLATGMYFISTGNLSTTGGGQYVENYGIDSSHPVSNFDITKTSTTSQSFNSGQNLITFSFGPQYYFSNAGSLSAVRFSGSQNLWGWVEP